MNESQLTQPQPPPAKGKLPVPQLLAQMHQFGSQSEFLCVTQDILVKLEAGAKKYGSVLCTHNGRSADLDAYQDMLDSIAYLVQKIFETVDIVAVLTLIDDVEMLYGIAYRTRKRLVRDGILEEEERGEVRLGDSSQPS